MNDSLFGFVQEFAESEDSSTGYYVKMLVDRKGYITYEADKAVYDMSADPFYKFPLIGEYNFRMTIDEKGILIKLEPASHTDCPAYSYGCPRTIGDTIAFRDGYLEVTNFQRYWEKENRIVYYGNYRSNGAPELKDGGHIKLSKGATAYVLDWTKGEKVMHRVSLQEMSEICSNGVYWIDIQSLYGEPDVFDMLMVTVNFPKDPDSLGGDLTPGLADNTELKKIEANLAKKAAE